MKNSSDKCVACKESERRPRAPLIDSHSHVSFKQFDEDREQVLQNAWETGVEYIVDIGAGEGFDGNVRALDFAKNNERIYATLGIHPHDARLFEDSWLDKFRELSNEKKVVAIGEIGLDYHYKHSPIDVQKDVFKKFLKLADEVDLPVVIHDREAHEDIWQIIESLGFPRSGGVFHCFSGDVNFAKKVINYGFFISVPGVVTFKNAKDLQEVVATTPLERLMLETDCPYLSPEPFRGKRNEPANVKIVAEHIAKIKGLSYEDVARVTTLNAKRFFKLPGADLMPNIAYQIRNSIYLNITNRCNLACSFCPKFIDFEVKGYYLKLEHEPDVDEVFQAVGHPEKYDEVVFCGYGEPTKRIEVLKVIAKSMKEKGAKKVRLNTDGLASLLYNRNIPAELNGLIDVISISLNAPNAEFYAKICPSKYGEEGYKAVCEFIIECKKHIPDVQVSVVALPDQDVEACKAKAKELGVPIRIREYMNVG